MKPLASGLLNRRNFLRMLAVSAVGGAAAGANAFLIEPNRLSVTRTELVRRNLPAGLDGLRIGLMADFHFFPEKDGTLIEKAVARVNQEDLDLLLLAGDYVTRRRELLVPLVELLEKARVRHGVYAVMGNHDGWHAGRDFTRRVFERAEISFLINQHSQISLRGESLVVAGTDFVWLGKPDPDAALRGVGSETPVVALVHEPDYFDEMRARRDILLQVSGHTHGGQCRVPWIGYAPVKVKYGDKYIYGYRAEGDSALFVTRGVGTVGYRVRFACPPELAILTLRTGSSGA